MKRILFFTIAMLTFTFGFAQQNATPEIMAKKDVDRFKARLAESPGNELTTKQQKQLYTLFLKNYKGVEIARAQLKTNAEEARITLRDSKKKAIEATEKVLTKEQITAYQENRRKKAVAEYKTAQPAKNEKAYKAKSQLKSSQNTPDIDNLADREMSQMNLAFANADVATLSEKQEKELFKIYKGRQIAKKTAINTYKGDTTTLKSKLKELQVRTNHSIEKVLTKPQKKVFQLKLRR